MSITLKLTDYEAEVLTSILAYQHVGEYDGGPLDSPNARVSSQRVSASIRIWRKLSAIRKVAGVAQ